MSTLSEPIVRFHQLTNRGRAPMRADRSAMGTLPMRAVQYCEALTSATAFGWWLFPPIDLELLWDGSDVFWRCDEAPDWMPLQTAAQLPNYMDEFDRVAPAALKGCSPPFLTALPEPGTLQLWTGLIAQTAPDWHLLVSPTVSLNLHNRPLAHAAAAGASRQDLKQSACEPASQRGDGVRHVALRSQRQLLWVGNRREG